MVTKVKSILAQKEDLEILSVTTGQLDIAIIPVVGAPSWIVPQSLILSVVVYHLFPKEAQPDNIVILESITDVYRIGLQIQGDISYHSTRIVDLKDVDDETYQQTLQAQYPQALEAINANLNGNDKDEYLPQFLQQSYVYQPVMFDGQIYIVPDVDKLSHFLVDLDG
jgi:hypothetical protein